MKKMILLLLVLALGMPRSHGQETGGLRPESRQDLRRELRRDSFAVHFAFNKYDQIEEGDKALKGHWQELAAVMGNPDSITITGFTDAVGTEAYNQTLSLMRARYIASWFGGMAKHNASFAVKIRVRGMGKQRPVSTIDSMNRRAEVTLYYRNDERSPAGDAGRPDGNAKRPDSHEFRSADTSLAGAPGSVIDTVMTLVNIFFVQNSPELTASSRMAMPSVINSLKRYKDRNLRILGNCNSPGAVLESYDPLFILSVNRARVIYEYLIREGFDARKMAYKGLGNSVMKNPHPYTREQMEENMRVDVEVFKK
jgi:outer membrane protein OmpA-like peptidoglycan-associated protein